MPDLLNDSNLPGGLDQRAKLDFERARQKAVWRQIIQRLRPNNNDLLPLEEVRKNLALHGQHYIGMRQVPLDQIVGSESRYHDFDRAFLPLHSRTRDRWVSVDRAHLQDTHLPAVELYKVGNAYFVKDGNHRVSVARERGQAFIDAMVVELEVNIPVEPNVDLVDLVLAAEQENFEAVTHLDELQPAYPMRVTIAGMYERLIEHISVHRWYLGIQHANEVPYEEAVLSWADQVYVPLVSIIYENNILKDFPQRTETDLYLWIIEHRWYLEQATKQVSLEEAAQHFAKEYSERLTRRWLKSVQHFLQRLRGRSSKET